MADDWAFNWKRLITTFAIAIISFYLINRVSDKILVVPDALGLGFFSVLGATFALQMDLSLLVASLMGVVTGMFGGILRDVLCNKIPHVFKSGIELYATCSFIGTWVFIILSVLKVNPSLASWVGTFTVLGLRILAIRFRLTLPLP